MLARISGALAVAAALAAGASAPASAAGPPCTARAAKAAVLASSIHEDLKDLVSYPGSGVNQVICHDFTRDGRTDMAITLFSGGTAGDLGFAVFQARAGRWQLVLDGAGYKLGFQRAGDDLVVIQPIYRKNDPNCCPTGGFDNERYRWNGRRFTVARHWHTKHFEG